MVDFEKAKRYLAFIKEENENLRELLKILIMVESFGNKYAIRFEPRFMQKLELSNEKKKLIKDIRRYEEGYISRKTALMLLSCSYGYIQILGYNFLKLFKKCEVGLMYFHIEVYEEKWQGLYLVDFLVRNNIRLDRVIEGLQAGKWEYDLFKFAVRWNGSPKYIDRLIRAHKIVSEISEKYEFSKIADEIIERVNEYLEDCEIPF